MTIVETLAAVVVVGIVGFGLWFAWQMFRLMQMVGEMARDQAIALPPTRLLLAPVDGPTDYWADDGPVSAVTAALERHGYMLLGDYVSEASGETVRGFHSAAVGAYGLFAEPPFGDASLTLWLPLADDTELRVTNAEPSGLATPPFVVTERMTGELDAALAGRLCDRLASLREGRALAPTAPDAFIEHANARHDREMAWHVERGGPGETELRAMAQAAGGDIDDELLARTLTEWQGTIIEEQLRAAWLATPESAAIPVDQRERLVFIADHQPAEYVVDSYGALFIPPDVRAAMNALVDEMAEADDIADLDTSASDLHSEALDASVERFRAVLRDGAVRAGFRQLLAEAPPENRFAAVGSLSAPHPADVYLVPPSDS